MFLDFEWSDCRPSMYIVKLHKIAVPLRNKSIDEYTIVNGRMINITAAEGIGYGYKLLIRVRSSVSQQVRPQSRRSKGEDTRKKGR